LGKRPGKASCYTGFIDQNVLSCIKMIDGYSKKGVVESAREVFNEINRKDHLVEDNTILASVEDGRSCVISKKEFWGSLDQNRRHGLLDPE
nr:hypothetical protein [Tanacetum cinerariifolium]